MAQTITLKKVFTTAKIYGLITIGTLITALGINLFHAPSQIVCGGLVGIGIIVESAFGIKKGIIIFLLNIPLFLTGLKFLGGRFTLRTLYSIIIFPLLTDLTDFLPPLTDDLLLASIAGAVLLGAGMGMVFLTGASTGGTDVVAYIGNKFLSLFSVGAWLFGIEVIIVLLNVIISKNYDLGLYGLIALFINTYLVDFMIEGANSAKMVYIISPQFEQISERVLDEIERGVTGISSQGMYTKKEQLLLMCVIKRHQIQKLEQIVKNIDPDAFIIFTSVNQVTGDGFKIYPIK